jgi:phospholipid/cholesterol/gamma-HCH transport system permease protein
MSVFQRVIMKVGLSRLQPQASAYQGIASVGALILGTIEQIGASVMLLGEMLKWIWRSLTRKKTRLGWPAIMKQIVRVGVRSTLIVSLVSGCVGLILVLQMAPPLEQFGRKDLAANILGVAVLRELGPLIAAIVLTGFAGASIAAELGTMVVGEEIEALEAQALNPVRFLVIPRVLATIFGLVILTVISNIVSLSCGYMSATLVVGIPGQTFIDNLYEQAKPIDFVTGMIKSVVFGLLIGLIACTNGLRVTGGAAGVGNATTRTVVQSIVCIVIADLLFTVVFYVLRLN